MNKGIIHYSNRPKNINQCVGEKFNILFVRLNHFLGINNIIKRSPFAGWTAVEFKVYFLSFFHNKKNSCTKTSHFNLKNKSEGI